MKVIAVLERFAHHNKATSPDNMVNYINYHRIIMPESQIAGKGVSIVRSALDHLAKKISGMSGYSFPALMAEIKVFKNVIFDKNLVHFFNADINCKAFPYLKGNSKVIATYHQPPDFFYQFFKKCSHIKRLDAAIVTSNVLRDLIGKYLPKDRIFFVPLAVDTELFRPANRTEASDKKVCLMVGNWLRDFETMREVIKHFQNRSDIEFHIITPEWNRKYFNGLPNIKFFSGLSFERYIEELHMAELLALPLKSCTSNLAILEAMACGLPIVTTDVGGIRDYVDESFAVLHPRGDHRAMADSIEALLSDSKRLKEMSAKAREHSLKFSWPEVSQRLKGIYRDMGAEDI